MSCGKKPSGSARPGKSNGPGNEEWQALGNKDRPWPTERVRLTLTPLDVFSQRTSETMSILSRLTIGRRKN